MQSQENGTRALRIGAVLTALTSAVMLGIWLASFPDLRGRVLWAILAALALQHVGILWFLRERATVWGVAIAAGTGGLILLISPVFAFYLFGAMIGAIGMSLPIAGLGAVIVIGHAFCWGWRSA